MATPSWSSKFSRGPMSLCREGFGDRNLRQLGSGQPYPDPEFPPPLLQNATFNAQQEYCKGVYMHMG